ncbi:uncharacterized protein I303_104189 [Kwoniella dejecticola CBS 10117]|uniref:GATA-type domain-containing protein n=1 Tax=Kwoniella dejecticola CBS 10117 TaxID=1296121 RepID=A0AAJ8KPT9_9TREE
MQQSSYSPTQTLPQVQPHDGSTSNPSATSNMMLPPLRMPNHNDPRVNPPYASSAPPLTGNHYGYSYAGVNQYLPYQRSPVYFSSGHAPQLSTSSSTGSELWTPLSANSTGGYPIYHNNNNNSGSSNGSTPNFGAAPPPASQPPTLGTIQPSTFQNWQPTSDLRSRNPQGTISPQGIFGSANNTTHANDGRSRLLDRRSSTPAATWERPIMGAGSTNNKNAVGQGENANEGGGDQQPVAISYTTDAEVKQTPELKRQCFNCTNKTPPSWRKSLLHPGKILCNKCGIFERTHHKPRPPQNDDQKLRKQTPVPGMSSSYARRDIPPQLQVMRDESDGSPVPLSPYSNVPSQATPVSATFSFPSQSQGYHSPAESLLSSRRMIGSMWNQSSPSQHSVTTPATSTFDGDYSSPIRSGYHAHSHAHSHSHSHGHGSSPYLHAYANRRTYSQPIRAMISPTLPSSAGPLTSTTPMAYNNGNNANVNTFSPAFGASAINHFNWNAARRHSDVNLHPSLSTSSSNDNIGEVKPEEDTDEPLKEIKSESA